MPSDLRLIQPDPPPLDDQGELQLDGELAALADQLREDAAWLSRRYPAPTDETLPGKTLPGKTLPGGTLPEAEPAEAAFVTRAARPPAAGRRGTAVATGTAAALASLLVLAAGAWMAVGQAHRIVLVQAPGGVAERNEGGEAERRTEAPSSAAQAQEPARQAEVATDDRLPGDRLRGDRTSIAPQADRAASPVPAATGSGGEVVPDALPADSQPRLEELRRVSGPELEALMDLWESEGASSVSVSI